MKIKYIILWAFLSWLTMYGILAVFWFMPAKRTEIKRLQTQNEAMQSTIANYKSAMKFENLFMLVASPNDVMDFEALDKYIQERKDFYKRVK